MSGKLTMTRDGDRLTFDVSPPARADGWKWLIVRTFDADGRVQTAHPVEPVANPDDNGFTAVYTLPEGFASADAYMAADIHADHSGDAKRNAVSPVVQIDGYMK